MNPASAAPANPPPPAPTPPPLQTAWTPAARTAGAFLLGVAATLLAVQVHGTLFRGSRPAETAALGPGYRLDLNRATKAELLQLPRVGDKLAERIVEHRRHEPYRNVEDLMQVEGVGPATMERLRGWLCVRPVEEGEGETVPVVERVESPAHHTESRSGKEKKGGPAHSAKKAAPERPINLNDASEEQLATLPGIGPKRAKGIVEERSKNGPFKGVDDLRRVSGIGKGILEQVRPYVTVETSPGGIAKAE